MKYLKPLLEVMFTITWVSGALAVSLVFVKMLMEMPAPSASLDAGALSEDAGMSTDRLLPIVVALDEEATIFDLDDCGMCQETAK